MIRDLINAICFRLIHGLPRKPNFQISRLALKPGDRLVVKVDAHVSMDQTKHIREMFSPRLPPDVQIIVIDKSIELSVLSTPSPTATECRSVG